MTQEERLLLLQDLCARLQYGVKCNVPFNQNVKRLIRIECDDVDSILLLFDMDAEEDLPCECYLSEIKPYLRPMSSMTEEEKAYYFAIDEEPVKCVDWLNKKMFDYRGLIPMGLALPAKEGMYNIKRKENKL